jgi:hypothetical protein
MNGAPEVVVVLCMGHQREGWGTRAFVFGLGVEGWATRPSSVERKG